MANINITELDEATSLTDNNILHCSVSNIDKKITVENTQQSMAKVKVDSDDLTAQYLEDKLIAGSNVTITEGSNSAGNKYLTIGSTGSLFSKYETSSNYTITDGDGYTDIFVTTGASTITVTLPTLADNASRQIRIYKVDSGSGKVTVDGEGSETINGETTIDITGEGNCLRVFAISTEWKSEGIFNPVGITNTEYVGGGVYQFTADNYLDYSSSISSATTITVTELPANTVAIYSNVKMQDNSGEQCELIVMPSSGDSTNVALRSVENITTINSIQADLQVYTDGNQFYCVTKKADDTFNLFITQYRVKL